METHLIETMAFSQRLSVRMFLSQSHLHEPFIHNACIFPPLLQNLYNVLFLSRKKVGVLVVSLRAGRSQDFSKGGSHCVKHYRHGVFANL